MPGSYFGRLLIVDDEFELLNSLAEKLAKQGYDTLKFSSPREALTALQQQHCDLLLTDLMMPEMDGITLLQAAQRIDPYLVAIVMTGQATVQTAVEALKKGAVDYIMKPFKINAVLPALARALEMRRLRLENIQLRETVGIYELCNAISFTLDFQTLLNKIADAAMQQCEAEEASIMLPSEKGDELRISVVRGGERGHLLGEWVSVEKGIAGWVARNREPVTLSGNVRDQRFAPIQPRPDICEAISMPMLVGGTLVGVLNVNSTGPRHPFTMGQVKALRILANTGAAALQSAKLHRELRRAEERYRSIFENSKEGILQCSPDGRPQLANPALVRMLGYKSVEDFVATVQDVRTQVYDSPDASAEMIRQIEEFGEIPAAEVQMIRRDGHRIWSSFRARAIRNSDGKTAFYESTIEDITGRKSAERRAATEHGIARTLAEASTLPEVLPRILQTICESLDWAWCAAWQIDQQEAVLQCEAVWHPNTANIEEFETQSRAMTFACGVGLPGRVWANAEPMWIPDVTQDENFPRMLTAKHASLHGALAFPIMTDRRILGIIECISKEVMELDLELLATIRAIGSLIGQFLERKQAEEKLRISQSRLAEVLDTAEDAIIALDEEQRIDLFNQGAERIFGYTTQEVLGQSLDILLPANFVDVHNGHLQGLSGGPQTAQRTAARQEVFAVRKNGQTFPAEASISRQAHRDRQTFTTIVRDITDRRVLEEQFRQSQKMEAVGQLAGGVAHDFNNLLTIIIGYNDLIRTSVSEGEGAEPEHLDQISKAAAKAVLLTRQLLAFSRKSVLEPKLLDLNLIIADTEIMLRRLIGEDILIRTILAPSLRRVWLDQGQVEQVLLNLAVNARDAMPQGGELRIETANVDLDAEFSASNPGAEAGRYVALVVTDSGCGMDEVTLTRIFEPFFTTKGPGKGTGLGLAMVYGIVKQSGGYISVESTIGQGATFKLFFPTKEVEIESSSETRLKPGPIRGTETILLAEDEEGVRELCRHTLNTFGYQVLEARNPLEAIRLSLAHQGEINLLVTDVVMPQVNARRLAEVLQSQRPNMKVLYISGYTDDAIIRQGIQSENVSFLQKPFAPTSLAAKIREVLDQV